MDGRRLDVVRPDGFNSAATTPFVSLSVCCTATYIGAIVAKCRSSDVAFSISVKDAKDNVESRGSSMCGSLLSCCCGLDVVLLALQSIPLLLCFEDGVADIDFVEMASG